MNHDRLVSIIQSFICSGLSNNCCLCVWLYAKTNEIHVSPHSACGRLAFLMLYYRWSPGKNPVNTVHVLDVAGAAWASANWMAREGRKSAHRVAGEALLFHNDKSKVKEVDGVISPHENPVAPVFNLVLYVFVYILFIDISLYR